MVEMPNMSSYEHLQEHFKVIETVVKKAAGRIHVIGGAGGNCTKKVRTSVCSWRSTEIWISMS
jgi:hypothetical protein